MSASKSSFNVRFTLWRAISEPMHRFLATADDSWRLNKLAELGVVSVTGALSASVISTAISWPAMSEAPWTTQSLYYSALVLSLASIAAASQQSIILYRIGGHDDGLQKLRKLLRKPGSADPKPLQVYIWQMPIMLLNIAVSLFLVGLFILIWDCARQDSSWNRDTTIAFIASLAGLFALVNYLLSAGALYCDTS
jgi:hypothetical protein